MTALFLVLALVGWMATWWWMRRRILGPLRDLRVAWQELLEGRYQTVRAESAIDEILYLARLTDQLAGQIRQFNQQITDEAFSLQAILSSMVEGVMIVDYNHRVRLVNRTLHELLRLRGNVVNRSLLEIFRNHELHNTLVAVLESGEPQEQELALEIPKETGVETRVFQVSGVALDPRKTGEALGAILVFHDITRIKELESVRREFVANVSHELRTPLSIITGYLETLLDTDDDPELLQKALETMHRHGRRLELLVEDLLTISRLESGTARMDLAKTDLQESVRRVVDQLHPRLEERSAVVEIDFPEDGLFAIVDSSRVEQVVTNLIDNAVKYGGEKPLLKIRGRPWEADGVLLEFEDNGPGIPVADQPHIFERFYRVHKDRSRDAGGTGLGLSIVKHVVQSHGGRVELQSRPGEGSIFRVYLPVEPALPQETASDDPAGVGVRRGSSGPDQV